MNLLIGNVLNSSTVRNITQATNILMKMKIAMKSKEPQGSFYFTQFKKMNFEK